LLSFVVFCCLLKTKDNKRQQKTTKDNKRQQKLSFVRFDTNLVDPLSQRGAHRQKKSKQQFSF